VHPQDGHWFAVTHALQARIPSGKLAAQHMVWGVPWALTRRNSPRRPPGPDSNENVQPNARVSITSSAAPTPKLAAARACHQAAGQPYSPRSNPFAPRPETRTPAGAVTRRLSMRSSASLTASSSGLPAVGELPRDASGARLRAGQARLHAAQCLHDLARSAAWIWDWVPSWRAARELCTLGCTTGGSVTCPSAALWLGEPAATRHSRARLHGLHPSDPQPLQPCTATTWDACTQGLHPNPTLTPGS